MDGSPNWNSLYFQWQRPAEIKYPNTWCRFETKSRCGQSYKIRIQDLPEDRIDEAIEFLTKYFFTEESICVASKLIDDGPALKFYQQWLRQFMARRVSIIAVIDDDLLKPPIVAMQCLFVETKGDILYPDGGNATMNKFWKLFCDMELTCDPFEVLDSDKYLQDWGLCTAPEFRGLGISSNILETLTHIGRTYNLKGTFMYFTGANSQKMAEKAGFEVFKEMAYNDYRNEKGEVIFPVVGTEKLKAMGKIF